MAKFTIHMERKVQVRQYEMLTIGLTQEFETKEAFKNEAFTIVKNQVNAWIDRERLLY